ncbi:MAG: hypothetical protein WD601_13755 [Pseudohongiellaceae bacterium]
MSFKFYLFIIALALTGLGAHNATAAADSDEDNQEQLENGDVEPVISRREASELVREQFAGRLLNIRLEGRRWRVRMDNEGTVFNVFVDARTGELTGPPESE